MTNLDTPLSGEFYPLYKRVSPTDTTFQIRGRFTDEAAGTYTVGKQVFCFNLRSAKSKQERFYMDVDANPTLIDADEGAYEYTISSLTHRGMPSKPAGIPPTGIAANRKTHEAGSYVGIVQSADYEYQIEQDVTNTVNDKVMQAVVFNFTVDTATGDGRAYFVIPAKLNNHNLSRVHARVITAGTTGTTDIQIRNVTDSVDMLSTKLTIDSTEVGSNTAAVPAVIDITKDDVVTNDLIAIDVDAVSTTAAKGLIVTLEFTAQ